MTTNKTSNFQDYYGVSNAGYDFNEIGADATLPAATIGGPGIVYTNNTGATVSLRYVVALRIRGSVQIINNSGLNVNWTITGWFGKIPTARITISRSTSSSETYNFDQSYTPAIITDNTFTALSTLKFYTDFQGAFNGVTDTIVPNFTIEPTLVQVYLVTPGRANTTIQTPMLHEMGARLLQILTGNADALKSTVLGRTDSGPRTYASDGAYSLNTVANGRILRGNLIQNYPITTSFADYFRSLDALFNLGLWFDVANDEFVIEDKTEFYKNTKIIDLENVKDLQVKVSQEDYFNDISCGYAEELDYEEINGSQGFNVPAAYANEVRALDGTLEIKSIFRADDYGIELARKNGVDLLESEDSRYDDKNFIITGQRDTPSGFITLQGFDDFTVITGVYAPDTRLNLNITPKRNLLRNENRLNIPQFITNNDTQYAAKQFELALSTQKSGEPAAISEVEDVVYTEEPLYYPEVYEFTAPLEFSTILQLHSDPHGYVEFTYEGNTYQGFILQVSSEPYNREGNWVLIKRNPNR